MHKIVKYAIIANIFLALFFGYSNFSLWGLVNSDHPILINSYWGPFIISATHHYLYDDGSLSTVQTTFVYGNYPFWLFWVAIAVNLCFIIILGRNKETK